MYVAVRDAAGTCHVQVQDVAIVGDQRRATARPAQGYEVVSALRQLPKTRAEAPLNSIRRAPNVSSDACPDAKGDDCREPADSRTLYQRA